MLSFVPFVGMPIAPCYLFITGQLADTLGLLNQAHDLSDAARGLGFPSVVATPYQFPSEGMHPGYGAHSGWCAIQVVVHF